MMRTTLWAACISCLILASCSIKPELMRRYLEVEGTLPGGGPNVPSIDVGIFSVPKAGAGEKGVFDLSDSGQAAFIEAAGKSGNANDLLATLAKKFTGPADLSKDFGTIERSIVLSVMDKNFGPADRLDRLELTIKPDNGYTSTGESCEPEDNKVCTSIQFRSWSLFKTEYGEVDLGKATLVNKRSLEASLALAPPQVSGSGLTLTPKIERDLTEEIQVRRRYVVLAGRLDKEDGLNILQQGVTGIDLVGTSQIDVTMDLGKRTQVKVYSFDLEETTVNNVKAKQPKLSSVWQQHPHLVCDVKASVSGEYRMRTVVPGKGKGDDTVIEGDDVVRFVKGKIQKFSVTLVPADETVTFNFKLSAGTDEEIQIKRQAGNADAEYAPMRFATAENSQEMLEWLLTQDLKKGDVTITSGITTYKLRMRNLGKKTSEKLTKEKLNATRVVAEFPKDCNAPPG